MTNEQARSHFNAAADAARATGNLDQAARIELAREYFTNSGFRKALEDHVFELNS